MVCHHLCELILTKLGHSLLTSSFLYKEHVTTTWWCVLLLATTPVDLTTFTLLFDSTNQFNKLVKATHITASLCCVLQVPIHPTAVQYEIRGKVTGKFDESNLGVLKMHSFHHHLTTQKYIFPLA